MAAPADLRRHNRALVLGLLARDGAASRAALAERTGLTRATVSAVVADLLEAGLVEELASVQVGTGRPAVPVRVCTDRPAAIGLELRADALVAVAVALDGAVLARRARPRRSAEPPATSARRLVALAQQLLAPDPVSPTAPVVVAVPGLVDAGRSNVLVTPTLGWTEVPFGPLVERLLGRPVELANEADLAALAECRWGAGREVDDLVYVSAGVGVGAGVVLGGELYRGAHGFGGELGHFVVEPTGRRCGCGSRGCLETVIGGPALERRSIAAVARALTLALAAACNVLDPEVLVLGGRLAPLVPQLEGRLTDGLAHAVLGARWAPPRILAGTLGPDAAAVGAAAVAIDRILTAA